MKLKLFLAAAFGILFAVSCKKELNNPVFDYDKLGQGAYLTLASTQNLNFNAANLPASVGITVKKVGSPIEKVNVFVVDDGSADQTWKLVKSVPFTGDSIMLSATGTEVAKALGYTAVDFLPGNTLTFFNQVVTTDGIIYDIKNTGLNVNAPDFNSSFTWTAAVVCPFTGGAAGDYEVIDDSGWADYGAGTVITGAVTDGPGANQITLHVYPNPAFGDPVNPMIVNIDPATGAATVPEVKYGDYGGTIVSAKGSGFVFSCTGVITLTLTHISYGNYPLVLKKL
ncbi:MAG: hypothetical protein ABIO55_04330 [Ginsengibacter sp.]